MTTLDTPSHLVHGTCHHDCPDSCGWHVTVSDGVAVKMRGNPEHPFSAGELCPKVNRFLDRVYSPDRVITPLRRVGAKGEGRFEPITWDAALAEIAGRWHDIIARHGVQAILPYSSAGNQSMLALGFPNRFWNHLGATRVVHAICGVTAGVGVHMTNGTAKALDPSEIRHAQLIILWGTNTRLTNRHLWPFVEAAHREGATLVVIDPLRTITADAAHLYLQPLPGTDVALMLGMMHVLIRDQLIDHAWVEAHTVGFDELSAHVSEWDPQRAAAVCGLEADQIEHLARLYGTIRPAAIRALIGAEHHEFGGMFFRTLACLPALVGAWRDRGGGLARSVGIWTGEVVDEHALSRPDLAQGPLPRQVNMSRLGEALTAATDPPIASLMVWAANPLVTVPDAEATRRGLARDDLFTVVHDQFITDTARYADIVLPATTQIESVDVVPSWGSVHLGWNEPAIEPVGEAVSNSELHRRLARAMGFEEPALFDDDLTVIAAALPTVDVEELRERGFVRVPYPDDGRPFGDGVFPTTSGRVELVSSLMAALGQPALPTYRPARESLAGDEALVARFPFALLTPKHHARFLNSSYSHLPQHGPREQPPCVSVSPADAQRLGVNEGQCVRVWNDRGSVTLPIHVSDRVRDRVVSIPWGWWRTQHPDGSAANSLTNNTIVDVGGGVAFSDTLVAIDPV